MQTIQMKMTWSYATEIYLRVLEDGTEEGKENAREELRRMAKAFDQVLAEREGCDADDTVVSEV